MAEQREDGTQRDRVDRFRGKYEFLSNFYPAKLFFQLQKLVDAHGHIIFISGHTHVSSEIWSHTVAHMV